MATKFISQTRCTLSEVHTFPDLKLRYSRRLAREWNINDANVFTVPQFVAGNDHDFGVAMKRECSSS